MRGVVSDHMGLCHADAVARHSAARHAAALRLEGRLGTNAAAVVECMAPTVQAPGFGSSAAAERTRSAHLAARTVAGRAEVHTGKSRTARSRCCGMRPQQVAAVGQRAGGERRKGVDGSCCCSRGEVAQSRRCWGRRAGSDWGRGAVTKAEERDCLGDRSPDAGRRWLAPKGIRLVCPLFVRRDDMI